MAIKGVATTRTVQVWDIPNNTPIPDLAGSEFTLHLSAYDSDGTSVSISIDASAITAGVDDGDYLVAISAAQNDHDSLRLNGTVALYTVIGDKWDNEQLITSFTAEQQEALLDAAAAIGTRIDTRTIAYDAAESAKRLMDLMVPDTGEYPNC